MLAPHGYVYVSAFRDWLGLYDCIYILCGVDSTIAHSVAMVFLRYPEERNELVWLLGFLL